jgi:hypothetical protein
MPLYERIFIQKLRFKYLGSEVHCRSIMVLLYNVEKNYRLLILFLVPTTLFRVYWVV